VPTVATRRGHSDGTTTLKIYAHRTRKADQQAADVVGNLLDFGEAAQPHGFGDSPDTTRRSSNPDRALRAASSLATNRASNLRTYGGGLWARSIQTHERPECTAECSEGDRLWDTKGVVDGRDGRRRLT
jgi:hypothetical protein